MNRIAGVWVKAELVTKRFHGKSKNIPEELKGVFCRVNGVPDFGYLEAVKYEDDFCFYGGIHLRLPLSNMRSFEWLDESPIPVNQDEIAEFREWMVLIGASLKELVELKKLKDSQGKTEDYLERQPRAWHLAYGAVELFEKWCNGDSAKPREGGDIEFLTMQFPGKAGSDIHKQDDQKELQNLLFNSNQQPIPVNQDDAELWKQVRSYFEDILIRDIDFKERVQLQKELQSKYSIKLKSSPSPIPVQEGLREELIEWANKQKEISVDFYKSTNNNSFAGEIVVWALLIDRLSESESPVHPEKKEK